jgi:hypothetical protein
MSSKNEMMTLAREAVAAGLVPRGMTPEAAYLSIITGEGLGLPPTQAMRAVFVVEGKITLSAQAMGGCLQRSGGSLIWHEMSATAAEVEAILPSLTPGMPPSRARVRWTMDDAKRSGKAGSGTWAKYPMAMLANRALSQVCRMVAPATFMGVYDPDEVHDEPLPRYASRGPSTGSAPVGYDILPSEPQIEAAPALPPKVEAMRARLEDYGWLPDAIAAFGPPATWDLPAVIAWGKARKEQIESAAARAAETTDETIIADDMP